MVARVYQNIELNCGGQVDFDKSAAHHLSRVLRLKNNSQVIIFNGDGHDYLAELSIDRKKISARILEKTLSDSQSSLHITLLQGISKGDRMDIAIQKSVELGVSRIIPVICQRTVVNLKADRAEKKHRHWQGVAIHACEQSGRASLPVIEEAIKFSDALCLLSQHELRLTLDQLSNQSISSLTTSVKKFALLIGPEGGLTEDEVIRAKQENFNAVKLGNRILRTETAALAAISAIQTLWGDFS